MKQCVLARSEVRSTSFAPLAGRGLKLTNKLLKTLDDVTFAPLAGRGLKPHFNRQHSPLAVLSPRSRGAD